MAPQLLASGAHVSPREAPELGEASRGAPLPPPTLPSSHLQDVVSQWVQRSLTMLVVEASEK